MDSTKQTTDAFVSAVQRRAGWKSPEDARTGIHHTLRAIGEALDGPTRLAVKEALPAPLRDALGTESSKSRPRSAEDLYTRVAELARVPVGRALEQVQAVLSVTGETVGTERRQRVRAALGDDVGALLEPRVEPDQPARTNRALGHTLATGRPGGSEPLSTGRPGPARPLAESRGPSARPLSEADPSSPHEDTVHEDNPRGDRKLASATPDSEH